MLEMEEVYEHCEEQFIENFNRLPTPEELEECVRDYISCRADFQYEAMKDLNESEVQ